MVHGKVTEAHLISLGDSIITFWYTEEDGDAVEGERLASSEYQCPPHESLASTQVMFNPSARHSYRVARPAKPRRY